MFEWLNFVIQKVYLLYNWVNKELSSGTIIRDGAKHWRRELERSDCDPAAD